MLLTLHSFLFLFLKDSVLILQLLLILSSLPVYRAAAMTLRTVLLSLQALLAAAEPDDPQDAVVANQVHMCVKYAAFSVSV